MTGPGRGRVRETFLHIAENDYFFLRLSMAAAKATADAIAGLAGSSVVSAMAFSCQEFAIRVAGLGEEWFRGPTPIPEGKLFPGHDESEISWMGGESTITETVGLGGFAQACALSLQEYQGGSPDTMISRNEEMYRITAGENTVFKIPLFGFRGTPTGVDIFKVLDERRAAGHGRRPGGPRRRPDRRGRHPRPARVLRARRRAMERGPPGGRRREHGLA